MHANVKKGRNEFSLEDFFDDLKAHDWFKFNKELNLENILRYLVSKLAERNPLNHFDVSTYIIEMISYGFSLLFSYRDKITEFMIFKYLKLENVD